MGTSLVYNPDTRSTNNLMEGSPDQFNDHDAADRRKTALLPVIDPDEMPAGVAETGVILAVHAPDEPRDDIESQDATRTPQEQSKETNPAVAVKTASDVRAPYALIVEDATELAEIIQATLERMNFRTLHQTHGNRALSSLSDGMPDVILLDIALPDITGWKFLDELKERVEQQKPPVKLPVVIVMTAYGDPANRLIGKLQGVHSYLIKPISPDELEKMVTQALNSPTA